MGGSLDMMGGGGYQHLGRKNFLALSSTAGLLHNIAIIEQCRILCDETHNYFQSTYSQVKVSDSPAHQPTRSGDRNNENLDLGGSGLKEGPSIMMGVSPTLIETME